MRGDVARRAALLRVAFAVLLALAPTAPLPAQEGSLTISIGFNPALTLRRLRLAPVIARRSYPPKERIARLCRGMELSSEVLKKRLVAVSIGQARRVGILRSLTAAPPLVHFDEPLSALDAITQTHTARLIAQLQTEEGSIALIVTQNLGYACAFADDIAVLQSGRVSAAF